jgi:2-polyprenyl-6-methoxyphenol hydroxylase-like FAD-dependent oxidoreductase
MARHAEIAGAGFAGLTAALALLQRGWTVRVHERTPFLRSEGFGIAIHGNGIRVLEELGVAEPVLARSMRIHRRLVRDADGRTTADTSSRATTYRVSRQHMVAVLAEAAAVLGGEILTDSQVAGGDPAGALILDDGRRLKADLVIAADGYNSRVRDSVGLLARRIMLRDGAMRLVIPRTAAEKAADPEGCATGSENWSGTRRVIIGACAPDEVYLALSCLAGDAAGRAVPVRTEAWRRSFPYLDSELERVAQTADWDRVKWVQFQIIKLRRWSAGRVAVVGDAANAMPPNLGQGGGCALMNALSLAMAVEREGDLAAALAAWEARERPITEHTQRWSRLYGSVTLWPERLRAAAFGLSAHSRWLRAQLDRTANYSPITP